jgi:transposase
MLTLDEQAVLRLHFRAGRATASIALQFNVSERSVQLWRHHWHVFGQIYPPKGTVQGRPRLLTRAQMEVSFTLSVSNLVLILCT